MGIEEAARLFSAEPAHVGRDALVHYAATVAESQRILWHEVYSPAEMVCGFADSLVHWHQAGDLPEKVDRRNALGPVERPVVAQEVDVITHDELISICRELLERVNSSGHLPANITLDRGRVGLGQIAVLAAKAYRALARYDQYEVLAVPSAPRYPQLAHEIDAWIREGIGEHWAMPLDLSYEVMAELARLQTWSMKPAWLCPPQGPVASGAYAARRHQT